MPGTSFGWPFTLPEDKFSLGECAHNLLSEGGMGEGLALSFGPLVGPENVRSLALLAPYQFDQNPRFFPPEDISSYTYVEDVHVGDVSYALYASPTIQQINTINPPPWFDGLAAQFDRPWYGSLCDALGDPLYKIVYRLPPDPSGDFAYMLSVDGCQRSNGFWLHAPAKLYFQGLPPSDDARSAPTNVEVLLRNVGVKPLEWSLSPNVRPLNEPRIDVLSIQPNKAETLVVTDAAYSGSDPQDETFAYAHYVPSIPSVPSYEDIFQQQILDDLASATSSSSKGFFSPLPSQSAFYATVDRVRQEGWQLREEYRHGDPILDDILKHARVKPVERQMVYLDPRRLGLRIVFWRKIPSAQTTPTSQP